MQECPDDNTSCYYPINNNDYYNNNDSGSGYRANSNCSCDHYYHAIDNYLPSDANADASANSDYNSRLHLP